MLGGSVLDDLPVPGIERSRDLLGREQKVRQVWTARGRLQIGRMVANNEQRSAGTDRRRQSTVHPFTCLWGELHELR